MTENEMSALWGKPDPGNRSITSSGTVDQWGWDRCGQVCHVGDYLYFRNGVLFSIQQRVTR